MATVILFAVPPDGAAATLRVRESPDEILHAFRTEGGPFAVTEDSDDPRRVWVNPALIAMWHDAGS